MSKPIILFLAMTILTPVSAFSQGGSNWNDVFRSRSITAVPNTSLKWNRVKFQHHKDETISRSDCSFGNQHACILQEWDHFLLSLQGKTINEKMESVNAHINSHKYVRDIVKWGVPDYWETPLEFLELDGDCEDFAIAKFYSLRRLGVPNSSMKIVVVYDNILRLGHAVLAVLQYNEYTILDNLVPRPTPERNIYHYRAIYSVNETSVWIHEEILPR